MRELPIETEGSSSGSGTESIHSCIGCLTNPGDELEEWKRMAEAEAGACEQDQLETLVEAGNDNQATSSNTPKSIFRNKPMPVLVAEEKSETISNEQDANVPNTHPSMTDQEESVHNFELQIGLTTAVGMAVYNFPKGLATFVVTFQSPKIGALLTVAMIAQVTRGALRGYASLLCNWRVMQFDLSSLEWSCSADVGVSCLVDNLGNFFLCGGGCVNGDCIRHHNNFGNKGIVAHCTSI